MATLSAPVALPAIHHDSLTGTPRANTIDRLIFAGMAGWFIVIVLTGFIPDSLMKIELVRSGARPPFPPILHAHAVLMGTFLLLLLAQTLLAANGRIEYHMRLGMVGTAVAAALVVVGFLVATTMYQQLWDSFRAAAPEARAKWQDAISHSENIRLIQMRIGILFTLFIGIALWARHSQPGLHKRMMILATAVTLPAGIDRIPWLPSTLPASPLAPDLYVLLAISPMLVWDVMRNRRVHEAYWLWLAIALVVSIPVHALWDAPWWHAAVRQMSGV
jgi:hypothetical protein